MSGVKDTGGAEGVRRFKPYPVYKDSGLDWLGAIPRHWMVKRVRQSCSRVTDGAHISPDTTSSDFPFVSTVDIRGGAIDFDECLRTSASSYAYMERTGCRPNHGDVLFSKDGTVGTTAVVTTDREFAVASSLVILSPARGELDASWLEYWLNGAFTKEQIELLLSGAALRRISVAKVGRLFLILPPELGEQRAIAAFLDRETARIDGLVAKKERLIELLQEQRTALITRAVTKGLDPNVPMKDSGVEWLGEIPAHWEAERIKWAARMVSGHTPDKKVESYWQGGDIPWVSLADTGQLREVDHIATTAVMTTSDGIAHSSAHVLPAGTVVFSRDATIGLCAITRAGMAVSQHFIGWVCSSHLQPEYLLFVLRAMTQELERLTMGATVRTIGMPDVKSLATPIPPLPEQKEIVRHVLYRRAQIDSLVAKVRDAIDRLKELRTALISAAVTGKIDVREEAA